MTRARERALAPPHRHLLDRRHPGRYRTPRRYSDGHIDRVTPAFFNTEALTPVSRQAAYEIPRREL